MDEAANRMRDLFSYEAETGHLISKYTEAPAGSPNQFGHLAVTVRVSGRVRTFLVHRIAWLLAYGDWPEGQLDHKNGVPTDNRLCNLRACTHGQNMMNRKAQSNLTGFKGVYRGNSIKPRYRAEVTANGKKYGLGTFDTPEEAHQAYLSAAARLHGPFFREPS